MAKYISLKFEPAVGTPFDYLINVEGLYYNAQNFYDKNGTEYEIPFDLPPYTLRVLMNGYIQGLVSDALQRPGNESFVTATEGPVVITEFA